MSNNNEFNNLQINNSDILPVDTWLSEQYEFKNEIRINVIEVSY